MRRSMVQTLIVRFAYLGELWAMEAYFPADVLAGMKHAARKSERKSKRLCVHVGEDVFPIVKFEDDGFAVDQEETPELRGLVDLYDGPRHLAQALIVRSRGEGDLRHYEYKRRTAAEDRVPLDYAVEREQPTALLR